MTQKHLRESGLSPQAVQILLSLTKKPRHGYGIKLDVEQGTGGRMVLGSGTLYQAIQRLERRGLVAADAQPDSEDPRRGRRYRVLPEGRRVLQEELARMAAVLDYARHHHLLADQDATS